MPTAFNVWAPQGNVVANPGAVKLGNPSVIPGLAGIVLGGTVFGGWFGDDTTGHIYYYESADGITSWTAYSLNPIIPAISAAFFPTVYTDGTTFYLYGCTSAFPGTGIAVFTSTDRVTWTAHGVQIPLGGVGAWDHNGTFQLNIVDKVAGTWYAYYSGYNGSQFGQGLVTSTDLITWTKSVSNPIFPGPIGNMCFLKASGFYFAYAPFPSPNTQIAAVNGNPIGRWSSLSPSGPWTQLTYLGSPVPVYYVSTAAELNNSGGVPGSNANDQCIVVSGGNIYLYYTYTTTGGIEVSINAALASGYTPTQLTTTYEGVFNVPFTGVPQLNLTTSATDSFTRADGSLGANWTAIASGGGFGGSQIASHLVEPASLANPNGTSFYNALSWPNDQWSSVTITSLANNGATAGGGIRENISGTSNLYQARWAPSLGHALGQSGIWSIVKRNAGTATTLATGTGMTVSTTDALMAVVIGTNIYLYYNGYLIAAATDSALTTGAAGFVNSVATALTDSQISAWSGGAFQSAPTPPPITVPGSGSLMLMGCGS